MHINMIAAAQTLTKESFPSWHRVIAAQASLHGILIAIHGQNEPQEQQLPELLIGGLNVESQAAFRDQQKELNKLVDTLNNVKSGLTLDEMIRLTPRQKFIRIQDRFGRLTIDEKKRLKTTLLEGIKDTTIYEDYITALQDNLELLEATPSERYEILTTAITNTPSLSESFRIYDTSIRNDVFRTFDVLQDDLRHLFAKRIFPTIAMAAVTKNKSGKYGKQYKCDVHGDCNHPNDKCRTQHPELQKKAET